MSTATILQLPQAIGLTGSEQLEGVQTGTSVRLSLAQIATLITKVSSTGPTGVAAAVPATGENDNYTASGQMGLLIGFVDLTPAGTCNITGLEAGFDGQVVIITNLSTFTITLNALNSSSVALNQFRMNADYVLTQNNSKSFKYSATIGKWVSV